MRRTLTHLDPDGAARMVDVSSKEPSARSASARAVVTLGPKAWATLDRAANRKGDALATARIAGIQAAKRTAEWIPLCHPVAFDAVSVAFTKSRRGHTVTITSEVRGTAKTGFEMEALTAVSAAALALYDMCKAAEKGIRIGPIELLAKSGGKSGAWTRHARRAIRRPAASPVS